MVASASEEDEQEALRLKSLAESSFNASKDLKSALKYAKRAKRLAPNLRGVAETVSALTVLRAAAKSPSPDWYGVLGAEPFAPAATLRKQYKKLALVLHPDKSPHVASDEAFKLVGEAFRLLSDRAWKKDYDAKLRLRIQEEEEEEEEGEEDRETFWTECSTCRLLHQFERKYVGHNLVCPSCKKSFKAVEVVEDDDGSKAEEEEKEEDEDEDEDDDDDEEEEEEEEKGRLKGRSGTGRSKVKEKVDDDEKLGDFVSRRKSKSVKGKVGSEKSGGSTRSDVSKDNVEGDGVQDGDLESGREGGGEWGGGRLRSGVLRKRKSTVGEILETSNPKKVKDGEETMTLAEFQSEVKRKGQQKKMKLKMKEKEEDGTEKRINQGEGLGGSKNNKGLDVGKGRSMRKSVELAIKEKKEASVKRKGLGLEKHRDSGGDDSGIMAVVDSDFYDFDKDRTERSFKKGQVWAVYDDDDGMPRHYVLIDEVVSTNPFEVEINWLDPQNNGDEKMISCMKMGFHITCGRFKVARKDSIDSVNIFSHVVNCDRIAHGVYRIYPKKGSIWALYSKATHDADGNNFASEGKRCYDIVVFLTSYSEINGMSMAYLEKVDGYKTVFKRQEMGSRAIRFLEKDNIWLVSHHIPARKLTCNDIPELLKDCWELDPASLPSDLLAVGGIDN